MENRIFKIRCSQIGKIMGNAKTKGELSQTCKSYLHEWYANDKEEIYSKYMEKGIAVENDLIDMAADVLGYGMAQKNIVTNSDEYFIGTCDVITNDSIIDVKASWNRKTLFEAELDKDYELQLQGYMHLYNRDKSYLFYGLLNTPETDYKEEIVYEDMPVNERWVAYEIQKDNELIEAIKERVIQCREYLVEYDLKVKSKLGKINK